jgi:hypothetical protein
MAYHWALILLATLVGALLRGWGLFPVSLSHFDEGQYAFTRVWPWIDRFDPDQAYFSPPLYPFLVGLVDWTMARQVDWAGVVVSLAASTATIAAVGGIGASWWNPRVGVVAAWACAVDPMQIAFARMGLTDALFTLLFVLTLAACRWALAGGRLSAVILAGVLCGSTWSCKYNGFLTVGLALAFVLGPNWRRAFSNCMLIAFVAVLCVAPWFRAVEASCPGGLASLAAHQRGYAQGWKSIPSNQWIALEALAALSPWPHFLSALHFAWLLVLPPLGFILRGWKASAQYIALWLVMMTLPGIYTPYLRLWLPTETLLLLWGAAGVDAAVRGDLRRPTRAAFGIALILATGAIVGWWISSATLHAAIQVRGPGYAEAARSLDLIGQTVGARRMLLLARPPLLFYLATRRTILPFARLSGNPDDLDKLQPNDLLVVDRAAFDSPAFKQRLDSRVRDGSVREIEQLAVAPSPVVLLDDHRPSQLPAEIGDYAVRVFRVH